ncbi:MAG TPA: DUF929 family protein [Candidatus Dormibacteraeota bacterium]|nr:DUF929 family protein [Candidatus Dormibacteraeota bacterium]
MATKRRPEPKSGTTSAARTMGAVRARPRTRRPSPWLPVGATVAVIAVAVGVFFLVRSATTPTQAPTLPSQAATQKVVDTITSIPASELDQVGAGTASSTIQPVIGNPQPLVGPSGKPEVLYVGAEYCPYCAAERWAMIIALSRFGSFSGIRSMTSAADDVYPSTPTFTFHGATYQSPYIDFVAVETTTNVKGSNGQYQPLDSLTPSEQALVNQYDGPPYTNSAGSIPFIDFGNRYVMSGATYQPDVIHGMSWSEIAQSLQDPSSSQAKAVIGSANLLTAAICKASGQQPANVCSSPTISSLEAKLGQ